MSTHISAKKNEIAKKVIMSGDPLRVKYIAEKYLTDFKLINEVRGMLGYTGYYKGKRISVMSHGMGIPSAGIYTYELFNDYDVDYIIRLGTAGSYDENYNVNDVAIVKESYSDSVYENNLDNSDYEIIESSKKINSKIKELASEKNINIKEARVYSADNFYTEDDITNVMRNKFGCNLVEMECFAIFSNARHFNKEASCLLTVSDSFITHEQLSSEEREKKLNEMIELGLDTIISL